MLLEHEEKMHPDLAGGMSDLLEIMVYGYFSRYQAVQMPGAEMIDAFLSRNPAARHWEDSVEAMAVTLLIVKITQTYLPHFNAHRTEDCAGILNVTMRGDHTAQLVIDPVAFVRFTQPPSERV